MKISLNSYIFQYRLNHANSSELRKFNLGED
jgi:hypothetical protein